MNVLSATINLLSIVAIGLLFVVRSTLRVLDLLLSLLLIALNHSAPTPAPNNAPVALLTPYVQRQPKRVYTPVLESTCEVLITSQPTQPVGLLPARTTKVRPAPAIALLQRGCDPTNRIRLVAPVSEVLILDTPRYRPGVKLQQAAVPNPKATIMLLDTPKCDVKIEIANEPIPSGLPLEIPVQRSCPRAVKRFEVKTSSFKTPRQYLDDSEARVKRSLRLAETKPSATTVETTTPLTESLPEFPPLPSDIDGWSVRKLKAFCSQLRKTELDRKGTTPIKNYSKKTNQRWLVKLIKDYYKSHVKNLKSAVV